MTDGKAALPEDIRIRLKNYINNRTGLYFKDYDLKDLDKVIISRMKELSFDAPLSYYTYVTTSEEKEDELRELLNLITINHTYFFRNEPQFNALQKKILPEIMERKGQGPVVKGQEKPTIRIWSAGCSTGEEPYTIAMIIKDAIPDVENWDIQILATDASNEALEAARRGVYSVNSIRLVDAGHKARYFTERPKAGQGEKYVISDEIKKMVNFSFLNLMEENYPRGFDIIFCRNVTIYFELETTVRVMNKLEQCLEKDGYLFIGYSETLQFISDKFKMVDWREAIFYVKAGEGAAKRIRFAPAPLPAPQKMEEILKELSKAQFESEKKEAKEEKKKRPARFDELLIESIKATHSKNYGQALSMLEEARALDKNAVEPYYLAAEAYTNQGRFNEAKESLNIALDKDMMFAPAHYLLGSIYIEEGRKEDAEKSYRKSLYLDKEFPLAHFSLGNIYRENGNINAALREYRNTLNILSKAKPYDILPYSGGFNVATLSSICRNNVERLKVAG